MNEENLMRELWKYKKEIESLEKRVQILEEKFEMMSNANAKKNAAYSGWGFVPLSNNPEAHDYGFMPEDEDGQKG